MFTYQIDSKVYEQKPLVWGQVKQLTAVLKGVSVEQDLTVSDLIDLIGDKMPMVLAVVLTEQGKSPKDKDLEAIAAEFVFSVPVETVIKVVEDFFGCNPTALYLEKFEKLIGGIRQKVEGEIKTLMTKAAPSIEQSSSSQKET